MFRCIFVKLISGSLATVICRIDLYLFCLAFKFYYYCFLFPSSATSLFANCVFHLLCYFSLLLSARFFSFLGLGCFYLVFLKFQFTVPFILMFIIPPFHRVFLTGVLPLLGDFLLFENHPT